jgi:hypothetical protein
LPIPPPRPSPPPDPPPSRSHLIKRTLTLTRRTLRVRQGGVSQLLHLLSQFLEASNFRICGGEVPDLGDVRWFRSRLIPRSV